MNGRGRLNKGKGAEREVIKILQPVIDRVCKEEKEPTSILQRNTLQSDRGGCDVVGLPWLALEIKRQETLNVATWWVQTLKQAGQGQTPVLMYRQSRKPWRVMLHVDVDAVRNVVTVPAELSLEHFLLWFDERLRYEISVERFLVQQAKELLTLKHNTI